MSNILGLKFRSHGQVYFFDSGPFVVSLGDHVIVKTEQGMGLGEVVAVRTDAPEDIPPDDLKQIYRLATEEDLSKITENEELATEAFLFCKKCIKERELDMKLVDVEVFFDRSKIIFYFTAPNRIDFRELVKDLVKTYRTRIELRQIGVRHETQMVGAVGNCGQVCCCRRFLRKFAPVTIKMAKEQNLFLNPTKISGICGRLLCCLNYEQENYEQFHRRCPKIGKRYMTSDGLLKVVRANIFRSSLAVITEANEEKEVTLDEWEALKPERPDAVPQPPQANEEKQNKKENNNKRELKKSDNKQQEKQVAQPPKKEQPEEPKEQVNTNESSSNDVPTYDLEGLTAVMESEKEEPQKKSNDKPQEKNQQPKQAASKGKKGRTRRKRKRKKNKPGTTENKQ